MITGYRREEGRFIFSISPSKDDYDGDFTAVDSLPRGSYDVVVTDEEVAAYREDTSAMSRSPLLAAVERGRTDLQVAADVALTKMTAENLYARGDADQPTEGVSLVETDAEAQAKFMSSLREGRVAAFDAIREQQLGEQWYEKIKERVSDPPTRRLPEPTYSETGLVYD